MLIPKILHITWKNNNLTEKQEYILNRWRFLHPDFKINFYTDEDNDFFIHKFYSEYIPIINKLKRKVSKIDFIRLLYLYEFGGIYVDLDVLPLKNLESFLNINDVVLCKEDERNAPYFKVDYIISNAIILARKNNDFIKKLIDEIVLNIDSPKMNSEDTDDVLKMTGPLLFNKVYSEWINKNNITLLESRFFNPMTLYDLTKEIIPNNIGYSFLVHLFDGTWWQKQYNSSIELVKKIVATHDIQVLASNENPYQLMDEYRKTLKPKYPLISCLCITKNNFDLVSVSIESFIKQIYPNKELIVLYEDNNEHIHHIMSKYVDETIKYIRVDTNPKKPLGELRNISIKEAKGEYICQWDDDDWYSPLRLWEQFYHMKLYNKNGSILTKWLVYDNIKNNLYVSKRLSLIGWEGSILYKKSKINKFYECIPKGEDTGFIEEIQNDIVPIDNPELYIYRIHSCNTWDYNKMLKDIINFSKIYDNQLYVYNIFNNSCLDVINNQYCDIMINNEQYNKELLNGIRKKYETGIVVPVFGRIKELTRMLLSLSVSKLNENIIFIFLDETNSIDSPKPKYWSKETTDLIKDLSADNINIIKIFKRHHGNMFDSIKTGFDILTTDFECENLMILDSDTILREDWYSKITKNRIFDEYRDIDVIISGFSKDELNEESRKIGDFNSVYYNNRYLGGVSMFFKKELYFKTKHLYIDKYFDHHISKYVIENNGLLLSLKNSVVDHIGKYGDNSVSETYFDVGLNFYYKINELKYILDDAREKNEVPKIIHRLLLYDNSFPENVLLHLKKFKKYNNEFYHVLWTEQDLLSIMNDDELKIYNGYTKKIQKSDYGRYIVLKYYGGIYCDFDIDVKQSFNLFFEQYKNDDLFFEETTISGEFIEKTKSYLIRNNEPECSLRIANYIMMCKPNSEHIVGILKLCEERCLLNLKEDYDILYTTGPDVVSSYFDLVKNNGVRYLKKYECDKIFNHDCIGHWRGGYIKRSNKFKISVIMQSYLGQYPNSRTNSEYKFIRAVNSFLNQTNKNTELVIISDGCDITYRLFYENFSNENRIKFIYVHNNGDRMYQNNDGKIFFRGLPREIGRTIATGEVITYMDSDDFLIPDYLKNLVQYWDYYQHLDWITNKSWYENNEIKNNLTDGYGIIYESLNDVDDVKIDGLNSTWVPTIVKDNVLFKSPALFSHKNSCDVRWSDVIGDISEDDMFISQIRKKYKNGGSVKILGYVRCHLKNKWDW